MNIRSTRYRVADEPAQSWSEAEIDDHYESREVQEHKIHAHVRGREFVKNQWQQQHAGSQSSPVKGPGPNNGGASDAVVKRPGLEFKGRQKLPEDHQEIRVEWEQTRGQGECRSV